MMALPSVNALIEWRAPPGTIATKTSRDDLGHGINGYLEYTRDHLIDLVLQMKVLAKGSAAHEVVMRESHARRVEIASAPARQALCDPETADVPERHKNLLLGAS